jgi:hypothetical protein
LEGKTVAVDMTKGGTFVTAKTVFERLGIKPKIAYKEQRLAYEKLRKGEIDAMVAVQGAPSKFITSVKDENMHFVPVDYATPLQSDYLPTQLKSEDYPALIPAGERVDTIAVPAILAAYNWSPSNERYRKVERFVKAFFEKFHDFQRPPFHPKWKEVVLNAPLKGWTRFPAAQAWLDQHAGPATASAANAEVKSKFDLFLATRASQSGAPIATTPEQNAQLFQQFLKWQQENASAREVTPARPVQRKVVQRKRRPATSNNNDDD